MTIRVAINGYGRIGRNVLRALYESNYRDRIQVAGINDLGDANMNAHLTKFDSVHGRFPGTVTVDGDNMIVNGDSIRISSERDPSKLPWGALHVDVVYECTGLDRKSTRLNSSHVKTSYAVFCLNKNSER